MRASLVIPTLDEAASIASVLRSFRAAAEEGNRTFFRDDPIDWEILVVDGASKDGTAAIAAGEGARVIVERRRGYGRAYRTGFAEARGEVIATADGDATYPVETVPALVRKLLDEQIDFLSGDRMAYVDRRSMTTEHRIGNWVLNAFLAIAYHRWVHELPGRTLADSQSGFWVFRRSVLDAVALTQDGMALSEELKIEAIRRGLRFVEVPIRYGERAGPPKLQSYRDGLRNFWFLFQKRLAIQREEGPRGTSTSEADGPTS
ncbi:MAG TPA: glycosyltransferase family 2 protein [Thermoplasmata archaeon]|nr:glycosyltransferase family 2 protein [Thermoplasmata archaeon]